jgi:hypothetical protein
MIPRSTGTLRIRSVAEFRDRDGKLLGVHDSVSEMPAAKNYLYRGTFATGGVCNLTRNGVPWLLGLSLKEVAEALILDVTTCQEKAVTHGPMLRSWIAQQVRDGVFSCPAAAILGFLSVAK